MPNHPKPSVFQRNMFGVMFALAGIVVLAKAVVQGQGMQDIVAEMGNDDIMRLTVVRDLIAGQGWFDMTQYRIVPPEGLSLHWSRYIDAGIAAIVLLLSWFVPMDVAEQLAVTIWPTLIMLIILCVVGFGTRRVFGVIPAVFAMMSLVLWPLTGSVHVSAGSIDHHNVQFLLSVVLVFAVIWPPAVKSAGVVAGLAAAFSLAIGLENLLFIVVAGLILVGRSAADHAGAVHRLVGFSLALGFGAIVFWLGQALPVSRFAPVCDQLGTPILSLVWVAVIASLAPLALGGRASGIVKTALTVVLVALGLALAWPLLGPCLAGPYSNLSEDLRTYISTNITEAQPAIAYAIASPIPMIIFTVPVVAALVLGTRTWLEDKDTALGLLLIFAVFGFAVIFYQMRTVIMVAAVVPMIGGVVMARLLAGYLADRDATRGLLMIIAAATFIAPTLFVLVLSPVLPKPEEKTSSASACRSYASLQSLNAAPAGTIFVHGNFGAAVILASHHNALGAPYHRSAAALVNGTLAFTLEEPAFKARVLDNNADYLLLCREARYHSAFLTGLAAGGNADWLEPVPLEDESQLLFAVRAP